MKTPLVPQSCVYYDPPNSTESTPESSGHYRRAVVAGLACVAVLLFTFLLLPDASPSVSYRALVSSAAISRPGGLARRDAESTTAATKGDILMNVVPGGKRKQGRNEAPVFLGASRIPERAEAKPQSAIPAMVQSKAPENSRDSGLPWYNLALAAILAFMGAAFWKVQQQPKAGPHLAMMSIDSERRASTMTSPDVDRFIEDMNNKYDGYHLHFENNFWSTKMGKKGNSSEELTKTKNEYEGFLGDVKNLHAVKAILDGDAPLTDTQKHVLNIMLKTFQCYNYDNPEATKLRERITGMEAALQKHRGEMKLGYKDPKSDELTEASSVQLRTRMRTEEDESMRKACYEGLRSIGPHIVERLVELVKVRNEFARMLGYEDFYDYKVTQAEGFNKATLFGILDTLEQDTHPIMIASRENLVKEKGANALDPWNTGFLLAGETTKLQDPYFPFDRALETWGRTFAGLGIKYMGATMNLDLLDRKGKYSNGFCHWPQPAWRKPNGDWVSSVANFTSLATPGQVGSGYTGLATLLHEGGHAAHFANIDQGSPFFSQERAPTSVAYAENQSMFLDSLQSDGAWLASFALDREGNRIPWDIVEKHYRATCPYEVSGLRAMLAVPYFEKALYELPEKDLTVEKVLEIADEVENRIQGGPSARPLLSVPHILDDESSCYYHGYVLAEMSVHQTRAHFLKKYGYIIDNPKVGKDLTEVYWRPGNGTPFLDLVKSLTGEPLTGKAWVDMLKEDLEGKIANEKKDYDEYAAKGGAGVALADVDLDMRVIIVHGDETIADSNDLGGFGPTCQKFQSWVKDFKA